MDEGTRREDYSPAQASTSKRYLSPRMLRRAVRNLNQFLGDYKNRPYDEVDDDIGQDEAHVHTLRLGGRE